MAWHDALDAAGLADEFLREGVALDLAGWTGGEIVLKRAGDLCFF